MPLPDIQDREMLTKEFKAIQHPVKMIVFPHLAKQDQGMGVPRTVINESAYVEGAVREGLLLNKLKAAAV